MNFRKTTLVLSSLSLMVGSWSYPHSALALDPIIRPYQSARSAGMGGVRMTTGLYDENFFNNPARVMANPETKFTLFEFMPVDTSANSLSVLQNVSGTSNLGNTLGALSGKVLHTRTQVVMPAFYLASNEDRDYAFAFGLVGSFQLDSVLERSYRLGSSLIGDIGPAFTFGHSFLADDSLSIGVTAHLTYRVSATPNYGIVDYLSGNSFSLSGISGNGSMFNFDLGATYDFAEWNDFEFSAALAIQNLLPGTYGNLPIKFLNLSSLPTEQPTSIGLGLSVSREELGFLEETTFAIEATDLLNNPNGSFFKNLHLGLETHWKALAARVGLNQGYWTAGLGLDFHYLTLNLATYAEEMSLNTGILEDRRYALSLGVHI
ncbi:MAG: hypothetical protein ACO3A2_11385 [Bdellovibrionia bacterium]